MKINNFKVKSYWTCVDDITSLPVITLNEQGDIVGSCIVHCSTFSALMQDLYVNVKCRRLGIASFMLHRAIEKAKARYLKSITIYTHHVAARLFFEKHGFFICEENQNQLTMTKKL